jgi:hypothetical protein
LIDMGAVSAATGAPGPLTQNATGQFGGSATPSSNAGVSADFRSNWQQFLDGITQHTALTQDQPSLSRFPGTLPASNATATARLLPKIKGETQKGTPSEGGQSATGSAATSDQSRRAHPEKLASSTHQHIDSTVTATVSEAASAASPGLPTPQSIQVPPFTLSERHCESTSEHATPLSSVAINNATAMQPRHSSAPDPLADPLDEIEPSLGPAPASDQSVAIGVAPGAGSGETDAPASPQSAVPHTSSVVDSPLWNTNPETGPSQSQQAQSSSFAGAQAAPTAPPISRPARALDSQTSAEFANTEHRSQGAPVSSATNTAASQAKHPEAASSKTVAAAHPAADTVQATLSAHQSAAGTPDSLTASLIGRPETANDPRTHPEPETQTLIRSTAPDAFAALDAQSTTPTATWVHAGTHRAEAGYLDPSLGWVGVRAETNGDSLHASIIPGSGEAAQALGGHLPALNSFLADHHGSSSTVTLTSPDHHQFQSGAGHSGESSAQQQPRQGQSQNHSAPVPTQVTSEIGARLQPLSNSDSQTNYLRHGAHISVIA